MELISNIKILYNTELKCGGQKLNKKLMLKNLKFITWGVFVLYLLVLVNLIILKDGTALRMAEIGRQIPFSQKITQINIIPLVNTIIPYLQGEQSIRIAMENLLGNIFAFTPLGFLIPFLFKKCRRPMIIFLISLCVSLLFEIVQLIFYLGTCDIDDLILNVLGSLIGYGVYHLFKSLYIRKIEVVS
ncbi:MAG: vanZ like family protein [Clostridiales bacterium]|jgi:glycopeptide antibiotics resistance protein|nr:vanZ like family protein [Clostridiales bacterium]